MRPDLQRPATSRLQPVATVGVGEPDDAYRGSETSLGTDVRFVVTNLEGRGKTLYEKVFCARGNAENLIKEMKRLTRSDKTACSRWEANQFRLFLHMGAYCTPYDTRRRNAHAGAAPPSKRSGAPS